MSLQEIIMERDFYISKISDKILKKPKLLKKLDREAGSKLLKCAVSYDNLNVIELIFEQKVNVKPLELAIARSDLKAVKMLLSNGEKLQDINWDLYALAKCIYRKENRKDMLLLMLKYGLDISSRDRVGHTLLHNLTMYFRDNSKDVSEIAEILINSGISINETSYDGQIPLHTAAYTRNTRLASFLIKKGANVNQKDQYQDTPLHVAVNHCRGYKGMINLLLLNGADINCKGRDENTALHIACFYYWSCKYVIGYLIQRGADIMALNKDGDTPFVYLSEYDRSAFDIIKEVSKLLFENISISKKDTYFIKKNKKVQEDIKKCTKELNIISSTKFHGLHTFYSVLNMSVSMKKLVQLTKNEVLVAEWKKKINEFHYYQENLQKILDEAIQIRDESNTVESRLKNIFDKYLPSVVISILAENLIVEDLPLE